MCGELRRNVEETFDLCWNCGTTREGVEDPNFQTKADDALSPKGPSVPIWQILALTVGQMCVCSVALAFSFTYHLDPHSYLLSSAFYINWQSL